MEELEFTWRTAIKLFAGLMLLGVWFMTRQQAKMEQKDEKTREEARAAKEPEPARRIVPRSTYLIVAVAVIMMVISLMWGNEATI